MSGTSSPLVSGDSHDSGTNVLGTLKPGIALTGGGVVEGLEGRGMMDVGA